MQIFGETLTEAKTLFHTREVYFIKHYLPIDNMGKSGSSHFRDPPLISEESPLKSEAVLIKYLVFWDR